MVHLVLVYRVDMTIYIPPSIKVLRHSGDFNELDTFLMQMQCFMLIPKLLGVGLTSFFFYLLY